MKKLGYWYMLFIFSISITSSISIPDYRDNYVNDFAGVLSEYEQNYLEYLFNIVEGNSSAEMVFVSLPSCESIDSISYATEIGEKWKVGKKDKDNGLVILYCAKENEIGIATGYGLEGILPDSKIGRFLDEHYVPNRENEKVSLGITSVSFEIATEIMDNSEEVLSGRSRDGNNYNIFLWIIFIVIISIGIYAGFSSNRKYDRKYSRYYIRVLFGIGFLVAGILYLESEMFGLLFLLIGIALFLPGNILNIIIWLLIGGRGGQSRGRGSFGGGSFGGGGARR